MARITLADLAAPEVELPGGHVYHRAARHARGHQEGDRVLRAARARRRQRHRADRRRSTASCSTSGCTPLEKGQQRASTVMKRLWDSDKITVPQLLRLIDDIGASDRPT
jgi:hypothetical protein